jgi:hypothetical protein
MFFGFHTRARSSKENHFRENPFASVVLSADVASPAEKERPSASMLFDLPADFRS